MLSPADLPRISIVTPCYNTGEYLEETICSVLGQRYPNLEYIIIDGGSSDDSVDIIRRYADQLHYWCSEPDRGMYDAIQKGFDHSTGDILGWINADDMLLTGCLASVAAAFAATPDCKWVQGLNSLADETGRVFGVRLPQFVSQLQYLNRECFDRHNQLVDFGTLQQESTFWRRELWERVNGLQDNRFELAGDFFLWMKFFRTEQLYISPNLHGAFRIRPGQQSIAQRDDYVSEMHEILNHELALLDRRSRTRLWMYSWCRRLPLLRLLPRLRHLHRSATQHRRI